MCDISFFVSLSLAIASAIAAASLDNTDSSGRRIAFTYQKHKTKIQFYFRGGV
jgi:hypothetical protein